MGVTCQYSEVNYNRIAVLNSIYEAIWGAPMKAIESIKLAISIKIRISSQIRTK